MKRIPAPTVLLRLLSVAAIVIAAPIHAAEPQRSYSITKAVSLGAPDQWDYLTFDPASSRVYIAHGASIDVIDAGSGAIMGRVALPGANGVAVVPSIGKGY